MLNFRITGDSYRYRMVLHDRVNSTFRSKEQIPHEWIFLNVLGREEIKKDLNLAKEFMMYILQYYPNYPWQVWMGDDYLATVICELKLKSYVFRKRYQFRIELDSNEQKLLGDAMMLGDIATDFLIRYRGYSLIRCSGQNVILTAHSDCHKRFLDFLSKGFSLFRMSKVDCILKSPNIENCVSYKSSCGFFYKLPVLPTREFGYPITEIIETEDGHYEHVFELSKKSY